MTDTVLETKRPPVQDWATDFDHTHPEYAAHAPEIWDDLRERCPVAHTDRFGGAWLPTRAADVRAIAEDTEHFTSRSIIVNRSEEHTSELQSLMRISYAVFCLTKKKPTKNKHNKNT